jgi:hypothetical protein
MAAPQRPFEIPESDQGSSSGGALAVLGFGEEEVAVTGVDGGVEVGF